MAFTLVADTEKGNNAVDDTIATTDAIDTTGADLIVVSAQWFDQSEDPVLSDSKGNTWTGLTTRDDGAGAGACSQRLFYCLNPTVGAGHTFTLDSVANSWPTIHVQAWSGANTTSSFDQENGAFATAGATISTGSVTPTENDELIVAGLTWQNTAGTISIDSGFTLSGQVNYVTSGPMGGAMAYLVQGTAAAVNPQFTKSSNWGSQAAAAIATFKAASTGEVVAAPALMLLGVG